MVVKGKGAQRDQPKESDSKKPPKGEQKPVESKDRSETAPVSAQPEPTPEGPQAASPQEEPTLEAEFSLNWRRAIHVNQRIDDALLQQLTPVILQMKQESSEPITLGIDSLGGNVSAGEALLGLLSAPDQDGRRVSVYTVCTNRAYSAAATLLAFGDYSVAFPHSHILYHDLRYAGMDDITPAKALQTARDLERGNAALSLQLANKIRGRIIWVYISLTSSFASVRKRYETFAKKYDEAFSEILPQGAQKTLDVVGFSLALFSKLSHPVDEEISIRALDLLHSWMEIERIERRLSDQNGAESDDPVKWISDLVADIRRRDLHEDVLPKAPGPSTDEGLDGTTRKDVRLLVEVLARRLATDKSLRMTDDGLDHIMEDFSFVKDINSTRHIHAVVDMMIEHSHVFFGRSIADDMKNAKDNDERRKILDPVYPQARVFWFYIVLICRCLCRGDHLLTPGDAQLLGIVDEVLGGGPVQSMREWHKSQKVAKPPVASGQTADRPESAAILVTQGRTGVPS